MTQKEIKKEMQKQIAILKMAQENIESLKKECKHPNTIYGSSSYRIGVIDIAKICSDCGEVIKMK